MSTCVLYLCGDPRLELEGGLVFPDELPEGVYSPGEFFVVAPGQTLAQEYSFDAVNLGEVVVESLVQVAPYLYAVKNPLGTFIFQAFHMLGYRYSGRKNSLSAENHIWLLAPANVEFLERMVREAAFYFIGRVLE